MSRDVSRQLGIETENTSSVPGFINELMIEEEETLATPSVLLVDIKGEVAAGAVYQMQLIDYFYRPV